MLLTLLPLGLPSCLFPSVFPSNILYTFPFYQFVLHAFPIFKLSNYFFLKVLNIFAFRMIESDSSVIRMPPHNYSGLAMLCTVE
jgi:hypothetical protein